MIRRIYRAEYADGQYVTFSTHRSEQEIDQGILTETAVLTGASYEYDEMGRSLAPKRNATESLRFLLVGTPASINRDLLELRQRLREGRRLKLWARGDYLDEYDDEVTLDFWAEARLLTIPRPIRLEVEHRGYLPCEVSFTRFSDWRAELPVTLGFTLLSDSETVTVNNPGTERVYDAVFTLSDTFAAPVITNQTNGYRLKSLREGASGFDRLRFDAGSNRVEFSDDGAATWAGDLGNFVRLSGQVQLMVLEPGDNELLIETTGAPSAVLTVSFYPAYH